MKLSEVIKNYRKENNDMTIEELSRRCGLSKGYISMLENNFKQQGRKKYITPSIDAIKKLSFGMEIDFDYLLSCIDGEVSLKENDISELSIKFDDYFPLHYSTNLSAGSLDELLNTEPDAVVYVPIKFQMKKNRLHAFKVNGTSMNNIIQDGSIVIVEDISDFEDIKDGTIVVVWIDGSASIKRIYIKEMQITLMPDSTDKSHEPIFINLENEQVSIIGRVIWHMNPDDINKIY